MMSNKKNKTIFVIIFVILIIYLFIPNFFINISNIIFKNSYDFRNTDLVTQVSMIDDLSLRVVARPPQTTYDTVIVTSNKKEDLSETYVYNLNGIPIGYIKKSVKNNHIVILFSSKESEEKFAVNGYVSKSEGYSTGSFSIQIPTSIEVNIGDEFTHQNTGIIIGKVNDIQTIEERNINIVKTTIAINPLTTSILYIKNDNIKTTEGELLELIDPS